jgi:hypothetical protein
LRLLTFQGILVKVNLNERKSKMKKLYLVRVGIGGEDETFVFNSLKARTDYIKIDLKRVARYAPDLEYATSEVFEKAKPTVSYHRPIKKSKICKGK